MLEMESRGIALTETDARNRSGQGDRTACRDILINALIREEGGDLLVIR